MIRSECKRLERLETSNNISKGFLDYLFDCMVPLFCSYYEKNINFKKNQEERKDYVELERFANLIVTKIKIFDGLIFSR